MEKKVISPKNGDFYSENEMFSVNMVILHAVRCATVYQVKIFPRLPQIAGSAGSAAQNRPIFSPVFFGGEAAGFGHAERQNGDFLEPKCGER